MSDKWEVLETLIQVIQGDITVLEVDAVIHETAPNLRGKLQPTPIQEAAGKQLNTYCQTLGGCAHGEAIVTPGFLLPSKFIIHISIPPWRGGTHGEGEMLVRSYRNALQLAKQMQLQSIAFAWPSVDFPDEVASALLLETIVEQYGTLEALSTIYIVSEDPTMVDYLQALIQKRIKPLK
ncbi:MAG: macro domain-containing protein [Erysipelotrichaceae bacterium]